jgi:transcriptional regulator with XRE-family HTH domain
MAFPHLKLKEKRESLGWSRTELAEKSGVDSRTLEGLEQGRRPNPTMDTIKGLCKALGVTCDFFFLDDPTDAPAPQAEKPKRGRPAGKKSK